MRVKRTLKVIQSSVNLKSSWMGGCGKFYMYLYRKPKI